MAKKKSSAPRASSGKKASGPPAQRWRRCRRWALFAALALVAAYAGLLTIGAVSANRLIFPVPAASYDDTAANLIKLPLKNGGEVPALWLENATAKRTVLYFHGNGMDLGHCRATANAMRAHGYAVLVVEYPGYGTATGTPPSEAGCYDAANSAYDYLRTTRGISAERIVLYGFSLGTGVATDLATRQPVGSVILEAPFLSTFRVLTRVKILPMDRFDNIAKIRDVKQPLLVIHGTADKTYSHGVRLFAAATGAPRKQFYEVKNGGHGDAATRDKARYWKTLDTFLAASE
ncbi:MAG: alpha/beta hydrolase [Puniceicoccales bacterium]|jgi:pimeloyl-ACP methyl ester carboxylesterase|nr:alpha/beta hydrolase [Puniceicoccales bacterium]